MMARSNENVAIFNPLVLPLPAWHPDGPDGDLDGYTIPFVSPAGGELKADNRDARILVWQHPTTGWRASTESVNAWGAYTAAQARALAGAWIRAAELLENVTKPKPKPIPTVDEHQADDEPPVLTMLDRVQVSDEALDVRYPGGPL